MKDQEGYAMYDRISAAVVGSVLFLIAVLMADIASNGWLAAHLGGPVADEAERITREAVSD